MSDPVEYFRIAEGEPLPDIFSYRPFKAVIVIDAPVSTDWQNMASKWLVESGCLYMMAWGPDCSSWDDSVDWANIDQFDPVDIPDESFVMTTWHEGEPLEEVFWFAEHCATAYQDSVELKSTLILDIGSVNRRDEMLRRFAAAIDSD